MVGEETIGTFTSSWEIQKEVLLNIYCWTFFKEPQLLLPSQCHQRIWPYIFITLTIGLYGKRNRSGTNGYLRWIELFDFKNVLTANFSSENAMELKQSWKKDKIYNCGICRFEMDRSSKTWLRSGNYTHRLYYYYLLFHALKPKVVVVFTNSIHSLNHCFQELESVIMNLSLTEIYVLNWMERYAYKRFIWSVLHFDLVSRIYLVCGWSALLGSLVRTTNFFLRLNIWNILY